jgi:uncharacterized 2Fe-2S/4Fe-4S cluster protein (DUF4445 family)
LRKKNSVVLPESKKRQQRYVWLNVLPDDIWLKIRPGKTIWEALQDTKIDLDGECGGLGKCGKCQVKVLSTTTKPPSEEEKKFLDKEELNQGIRLACRTPINEDLVISTGEAEVEADYFQILTTSHELPAIHRPQLSIKPLVEKRHMSFATPHQYEWLSDLDRIKMLMGPEYRELNAPLNCLHALHEALKKTDFRGTAVLHDNSLLDWQASDEVERQYGLVFDLGTSTVVGKIYSLINGVEVAVSSRLNSQYKYGSNVISRIQYIMDNPQGLERLKNLIIRDINILMKSLLKTAEVSPEEIFIAVAAGNTTMQHIMLGLDPSGIASAPFSPVITDGMLVKTAEVGLELHPEALFYIMPTKSGYIGGDLISVILASGVSEQKDELILGMDLGTNGEIFLGNRKRLMTCSAAAGPALEGARISNGMIASAGAIEGAGTQDGNMVYNVIGNVSPKGICGSGLVELIAILAEMGIISRDGLIHKSRRKVAKSLNSRITQRGGVNRFVVASASESGDGKPVYLTQKDVREVQLAKAAIAAGIKTLMDEMNVRVEDISRVYLAGALGNYVKPERAMDIGLIPRFPPETVTSLGNAASTGASMVLLCGNYWQTANELADAIEHIELSSRLDFNQHFIENMDFPQDS